MPSIACVETTGSWRVLLVLIAYHPPAEHVDRLLVCLSQLPAGFQYALVVNDHHSGEAVEALRPRAAMSLVQQAKPGYGRGFNQLWERWCAEYGVPPLVVVLNTDLSWETGCFEQLASWLVQHPGSPPPLRSCASPMAAFSFSANAIPRCWR